VVVTFGSATALVVSVAALASAVGGNNLVTAINQYREHLVNTYEQRGLTLQSDRDRVAKIREPVSNNLPCSDRGALLADLTDLGLFPTRSIDTGHFEDEVVVAIEAAALGDECAEVRKSAFYYLFHYATVPQLASQALTIKAALTAFEYSDAPELLALLPLSDDARSALLARPKLPTEVRARLGDRSAEARLVKEFAEARTFREKQEAAERLGYAGTRLCAGTLVKGLNSTLVQTTVHGPASIRYDIIVALGRIHPEEPLLTSEIRKIYQEGDRKYGGAEAIQSYLEQVVAWAKHTYGVEPDGPPATPMIYDRHVAIRW
jgi:hypothetical protein